MHILLALLLAQFDPATMDPRVEINLSDAPACAGIGPQYGVPTPVRLLKSFPSRSYGCGNGYMTGDGQGDVAYQCTSYLPESGWAQVISADGAVESRIFTYSKPIALDDGFAAQYDPAPYGPRQQTVTFSWFDGAQWQSNQYVDPEAEARWVVGHPWTGVLLYRDHGAAGPTTQWVDAHGFALADPVSWGASSIMALGVDSLGNAAVQADGATQWIDQTTSALSDPFPSGASRYSIFDPLIGGGFVDRSARVMYPDSAPSQPAPPWMTYELGDMQVINGGVGYAFTNPHGGSGCGPTVSLYAPDGTACGTVNLYGPRSACPQLAALGVDGTLIQDYDSGVRDRFNAPIHIWRWFPQMFR